MGFIIGLLTVVLVLDSLLLILLVLIQLPKKEAGAGVAFGGGATDALFGAGSGNALTKITRYAATVFFSLALIISILYARHNPKDNLTFQKNVKAATAAAAASGQSATPPAAVATPSSNMLTIPVTTPTNSATAPTTNSSAPPSATPPK